MTDAQPSSRENPEPLVNAPKDMQPPRESNALPPATPHPQLDELIAVLELLRAPGGCAWDAEQSHESLVRYLIEETYELVDAIESGNRDELIEELGDVLYQVIFHSDIAAHTPSEAFTIEDVAAHMTAKMVGRHPHVFGDAVAETASDVNQRWDELKRVEKPGRKSVLDGVPQAMPSLLLADKLLGKAEKLGVAAVGKVGVVGDVDEVQQLAATPELGTTLGFATVQGLAAVQALMPNVFESEEALGAALLLTVSEARSRGLDAERALRSALRDLQDRMRAAETIDAAERVTGAR